MKRLARLTTGSWLGGSALAAVGVVVTRIAAPRLDLPVRPLVQVAGELLAIGGLVVIAWGVSRRVRQSPPAKET